MTKNKTSRKKVIFEKTVDATTIHRVITSFAQQALVNSKTIH